MLYEKGAHDKTSAWGLLQLCGRGTACCMWDYARLIYLDLIYLEDAQCNKMPLSSQIQGGVMTTHLKSRRVGIAEACFSTPRNLSPLLPAFDWGQNKLFFAQRLAASHV